MHDRTFATDEDVVCRVGVARRLLRRPV